jgi:hypothetical protein
LSTVLPKIQANQAGAADALMLDTDGFVSETNATNVFMIKHGAVLTPHADYCLPGGFCGVFPQHKSSCISQGLFMYVTEGNFAA